MLVAWRDDGFWTLIWLRCLYHLRHGVIANLPGAGFIGQESKSFRATEATYARLKSTRMHRVRSTPDAPLWRLICSWEAYPSSQIMLSGNSSVDDGR